MVVFKLKNLKEGMILAKEVKDLNGRVLLKAGTEITSKYLKICKAWGITEADVHGVEVKDIENANTENLKPASLAKAEAEVRKIFYHADISHPAVRELFNLCVLKKAKSISEKEAK